jgi:hypothetical protein
METTAKYQRLRSLVRDDANYQLVLQSKIPITVDLLDTALIHNRQSNIVRMFLYADRVRPSGLALKHWLQHATYGDACSVMHFISVTSDEEINLICSTGLYGNSRITLRAIIALVERDPGFVVSEYAVVSERSIDTAIRAVLPAV